MLVARKRNRLRHAGSITQRVKSQVLALRVDTLCGELVLAQELRKLRRGNPQNLRSFGKVKCTGSRHIERLGEQSGEVAMFDRYADALIASPADPQCARGLRIRLHS